MFISGCIRAMGTTGVDVATRVIGKAQIRVLSREWAVGEVHIQDPLSRCSVCV